MLAQSATPTPSVQSADETILNPKIIKVMFQVSVRTSNKTNLHYKYH